MLLLFVVGAETKKLYHTTVLRKIWSNTVRTGIINISWQERVQMISEAICLLLLLFFQEKTFLGLLPNFFSKIRYAQFTKLISSTKKNFHAWNTNFPLSSLQTTLRFIIASSSLSSLFYSLALSFSLNNPMYAFLNEKIHFS